MSEARTEKLTRQPRAPSQGGELPIETPETEVETSPEEALREAQEAKRLAEEERDAARSREQTTARERDEARARASSAQGEATSAQERALITSIDTAKRSAEQAKVAIANAQTNGDAVAVADAFDQLADARADIKLLEQRKQYFEGERERAKAAPPQAEGFEITTPGGAMRVSAQVKQWADSHSRFYNDRDYYNHAVAAHATVLADGVNEGSPAYFRALDGAMQKFERYESFDRGELQAERGQMNEQRQSRPRPASSMGAPVSRGTESRAAGSREPSEGEIARHLGVDAGDLREYARINGYGRTPEGYKRYLADHQEIIDLERRGGDTGLHSEGNYR